MAIMATLLQSARIGHHWTRYGIVAMSQQRAQKKMDRVDCISVRAYLHEKHAILLFGDLSVRMTSPILRTPGRTFSKRQGPGAGIRNTTNDGITSAQNGRVCSIVDGSTTGLVRRRLRSAEAAVSSTGNIWLGDVLNHNRPINNFAVSIVSSFGGRFAH